MAQKKLVFDLFLSSTFYATTGAPGVVANEFMQPDLVTWNYIPSDYNYPEPKTCLKLSEDFYQMHSPFSLRHDRQNTERLKTYYK
jgi:hypothetical protein